MATNTPIAAKYQVNVDSVLDCQMEDYECSVKCKDFDEAKKYALDAFETVIDRLTYLCEQIREAEDFEDLDLGWWEPLFEKIEGADQSSEEIPQTSESKE